jgi:putative (di)nucleoside polyphosphate hydrolase
MSNPASEPEYRPCVGIMVLNRDGLVWMGRRFDDSRDYKMGELWQMPQGGIDPGEEPVEAALRELYEETSIKSVEILQESQDWFKYDLPAGIAKTGWRARYRGQIQKWFAVRFEGADDEINILDPGDGNIQEFDLWKWVPMADVPGMIIAFKRGVYDSVVEEFADLANEA